MIRVVAIGDVVGRAGRNILESSLPRLRKLYDPEIVLLNGENAAGGYGLTKKIYDQMTEEFGIDCITMGNHWHDNAEILEFADSARHLCLPANMGNVRDETMGLRIIETKRGNTFAVMNFIGRAFMKDNNRNPFEAAARLLPKIPESVRIRIVDMHAEATSEKQAMAHFLTGRVSLVYGTHSHVPTADERIFADGTGFTTDIGLTGAYDSIIGMNKEAALKRLLTGAKTRLEPAEKDPWLCALVADIDEISGFCTRIERLRWKLKDLELP